MPAAASRSSKRGSPVCETSRCNVASARPSPSTSPATTVHRYRQVRSAPAPASRQACRTGRPPRPRRPARRARRDAFRSAIHAAGEVLRADRDHHLRAPSAVGGHRRRVDAECHRAAGSGAVRVPLDHARPSFACRVCTDAGHACDGRHRWRRRHPGRCVSRSGGVPDGAACARGAAGRDTSGHLCARCRRAAGRGSSSPSTSKADADGRVNGRAHFTMTGAGGKKTEAVVPFTLAFTHSISTTTRNALFFVLLLGGVIAPLLLLLAFGTPRGSVHPSHRPAGGRGCGCACSPTARCGDSRRAERRRRSHSRKATSTTRGSRGPGALLPVVRSDLRRALVVEPVRRAPR